MIKEKQQDYGNINTKVEYEAGKPVKRTDTYHRPLSFKEFLKRNGYQYGRKST